MKNLLKESWFWIIGASLIVAVGILFFGGSVNLFENNTALIVNGEEYSKADFNSLIDKTASQYEMYGMETTKKDLKDQAVEQAVQEILLAELAENKGVEVTDEDVQEFTEELISMYGAADEEELVTMLKEQGLKDKEEMDGLFRKQVEIDKLIEIYSEDIEVTEDEVENYYQTYKEQAESSGQEVPALEEVREDIKLSLIQERATQLILEEIEKMKEDAEIEVLIEDKDIEKGTVSEEEVEQEDEEEEQGEEVEEEQGGEEEEEVSSEEIEIELEE
jgi:hypothetical protein